MSTPATLADLRALAPELLADQSDARRHMAGAYLAKCLRAIDAHDYRGARLDLVEAAHRLPELAAALGSIDAAERGAKTSPARAAASRSNGARGGRPRETPAERALRRRCAELGRALAAAERAARRHDAGLSPTIPPVPREFPLDREGVLDRLRAGVVCRDPWDAPLLCELDDDKRRRLVSRRDPVGMVLSAAAAAWRV